MTSYTKSTNFATKDTLTSGDPLKIVKGTEINTEFDNIATAVNSKSDTASPTFTGTVTIPTVSVSGTTDSTSTSTGSVVTAGGLGVAKATFIGTTLNVASTTTLTGVATLTANPVLSTGTANGVTYLNGSKSLTSGSAITFDGTNFATTGTASATKLIPTGSSVTGNGLYLPAANSLGLSTNGTNAVYIDSSQNVGIGTTSPSSKLQVAGSGFFTSRSVPTSGAGPEIYYDGTSAGWLAYNRTSSAYIASTYDALSHQWAISGGEGMRITSAGNVGIGVTPSTWALSGQKVLQVLNASLSGYTTDEATVTGNAFHNGSGWRYIATNFAEQYSMASGQHRWYTAASGTAGNAITFTQAMTLDASGNLGIGTTSGFNAISGTETTVYVKNAGANVASLYLDAVRKWAIYSGGAGQLAFYDITGSAERMRIDTVGNAQFQAGAVMPYAPAPTGIAAATTLTNAQIQGQIISATGTTYTITMPLGTTMETLATWATTNIAYDFFVINTASGTVTMAVNTGVTSLGTLTIATGVSAHFRIRRTAANTFVLYRLV